MLNGQRSDNPPMIKPHTQAYQESQILIKNIILRHHLYQQIRCFFINRGYMEVETPILVPCPGIDPHIEAIATEKQMYLATSPELHMKRLLGMGMKRIFQFTKAFRKGEEGGLHNPEFSILEWYHTDEDYLYLMGEVEALIRELVEVLSKQGINYLNLGHDPFPKYTIDNLFDTYAGWIPSENWDEERFFLDFIEKVEPQIGSEPAVIIYDFPAPLASLARLKSDDPLRCERFELYLDGLEVSNAFTELTDPREQKERFFAAQERRRKMGKDAYPLDHKFLQVLEKGLLPPCTGIAMGLDRLIMALTGEHRIEKVMTFSVSRL
ncbi:MAG: EF-P lysine aminoacylase EpmA [bacterium]